MAETHVVSALVAKRSELAGFIADLEKRAAQHRADLGHVDAVLRLYGEAKPEAIRPKRVTQRNAWFSPGECARLVYDTLRPAEKPVGTREITEAAMTAKGLEFSDERIRRWFRRPYWLHSVTALCAKTPPADTAQTDDPRRHGRQEHRRVETFDAAGQLGAEWEDLITTAIRVTRLTWHKDTKSG
jgi:hypothetical protein